MATSKAQLLAAKKYRAKNYDTIGFDVKKGKRDEYKQKAASLGLSLAAFLTVAADAYNVDDTSVPTPPAEPALTEEQRKILDAVSNLSPQSQKALIKFLQTLKQDT